MRAVRKTPLAVLPLAVEGLVVAVLVVAGAFPHNAGIAPSTAVFPLDVFFDLKQSLAFTSGWPWFFAAVIAGMVIRAIVLASTLWLGDERRGSLLRAVTRVLRLAAVAVIALFPSAGLFFVGVATRYAPFIWIAALLGVVPSLLLLRRAVALDAGAGVLSGKVPEGPGFLTYAYLVAALGAAISALSGPSRWPAAILIAVAGPVHALFLLGWRHHARAGTYPGGGTVLAVVTAVAIVGLFALSSYDRFVRKPEPVKNASRRGSLLLLGGVDSGARSGPLADFNSRVVGYRSARTDLLSYSRSRKRYRPAATRARLTKTARIVARQIARSRRPRNWLGHSQAALILDRILERRLPAPRRAVELAPPPPIPPPVRIPSPGRSGAGKPGGDVARAFAKLLDVLGMRPFDVDAPASPTNLKRVVVRNAKTKRLAVWALQDSVWLSRDWRRPGEVNIVALTDHVGVTNNERALTAAKDFFRGKRVTDDESSWESVLVNILRYAFQPWQPR